MHFTIETRDPLTERTLLNLGTVCGFPAVGRPGEHLMRVSVKVGATCAGQASDRASRRVLSLVPGRVIFAVPVG